MQMQRRTGFFMNLLLLLAFSVPSVNALSLEEAVFTSLATHPELQAKKEALYGVQKERDQVLSGYFPKIDLSSGAGRAIDVITPKYRQSGAFVTRLDTSLTATLNLFNGFSTLHELGSQTYKEKASRSYVNETQSSVALRCVEAYIAMAKYYSLLKISKENVLTHEEIYDKLKEKSKLGFGRASDLGFALERLTLAQVNAVVNENNFIQAKLLFESIYGTFVDTTSLQEPQFDYTLPLTLEDAALMALDYNPSIKTGVYNTGTALENYKRSKAVYYPQIDLELRGALFNETGAFDYSVNSSYAMIYLNYNLYNGFADKANIERNFYLLQQNRLMLDNSKREIMKQLGVAWVAQKKIEQQLQLLDKVRTLSQKNMQDYFAEFAIGKRSLLDIINVKNDVNSALQSYEVTRYDLLLAKFRILNALGGIVDYFAAKADTQAFKSEASRNEADAIYDIIKQTDMRLNTSEGFGLSNDIDHTSIESLLESKKENTDALDDLE